MGSMKGQTTASALFEETVRLCSSISLDFTKLLNVTTDGALVMTGETKGLVSPLIKYRGKQNRQLLKLHFIIYQQNLCSKELGFQTLMELLKITINFIKSRWLNHRQFLSLLEEIDANYGDLVCYCEVRWLSRGKTLQRSWELIEEIIKKKKKQTNKDTEVVTVVDPAWQADLTFVVDMTQHLNDLNLKLQAKNQLVFQLANHISTFRTKF